MTSNDLWPILVNIAYEDGSSGSLDQVRQPYHVIWVRNSNLKIFTKWPQDDLWPNLYGHDIYDFTQGIVSNSHQNRSKYVRTTLQRVQT